MQNVEWVTGEWVIPLRLLRLLEHLAVLIKFEYEIMPGWLVKAEA